MTPERVTFYKEKIEYLHMRLLNTVVVSKWLTAQGLRLAGKRVQQDDVINASSVTLNAVEFAHLFSVFNGSRIHVQPEHSYNRDDAPPGLYFTVTNRSLIQNQHKNKIGIYQMRTDDKLPIINNLHIDHFFLSKKLKLPFLGTFAFALCAITTFRKNFSLISLIAAGSGDKAQLAEGLNKRHYTGYRFWPKVGFSADLHTFETSAFAHLRDCKTVQDVVALDENWWASHGTQRTMVFDLAVASRSWTKLLSCLEQKLGMHDPNVN